MGAKWPFQQFCWDTGQLALPSSHGVGTSSTHRHQLPPVPARHSQHQRAGPTHKFPVVPSPAQQGLGEEEEGGRQPCTPRPWAASEKPCLKAAERPRAFQGREGLLLAPSIPHHSRGRARKKASRTGHPERGGCTQRRGCSGTECWGQ